MSLPKTHTFNGIKYHLIFDELDGNCDTDDKYWIIFERDLRKRVGLETVIHESLHACSWLASEEKVSRAAKDISRLLWNIGYRLKGDEK